MSPSIAQQIGKVSANLDVATRKGEFLKLCTMLLVYKSAYRARQYVEAERCTERISRILKAAVTGGTMGDWSSIADYQNIVTAFTESLRTLSVFDAVLADGMIKAPLRSRGFVITTGITGANPGEGAPKPVSQLSLSGKLLEPQKVTATLTVTEEVANSPGARALFTSELTKGIVAATDSSFLAALIAATTPIASGGATLPLITADFDALLSAVTTTATSKLYYVASPANIKSIMTKANAGGQPAYPNLGINGGEIFPGVQAIASDQISASAALMFDATAILGNSDTIRLDGSDQTSLQMQTAPDSPAVASTILVSTWQTNSLAFKAERFLGFSVLRSSGVASLSGVAY